MHDYIAQIYILIRQDTAYTHTHTHIYPVFISDLRRRGRGEIAPWSQKGGATHLAW